MSNLPDPAKMTSAERLAYINENRLRVARGEEVPEEVLRHCITLLRMERNAPRTRAKAPPAAEVPLDDLLGGS